MWSCLRGTRSNGKAPARTDLLGYAIERAELDLAGNEVERYWMRGIKRFKDKDKGLPPGTPVSTAEHPIQSFLWADYTAKAGTRYLFRIVPLYGTVKNPKLDDAAAVTLDVTAEIEGDQPPDDTDDSIRHDVFFNRGVIGSQAYAREFGNREPDAENPRSQEMKWLSRGPVRSARAIHRAAQETAWGFAPPSTSSTTSPWPTRSPRRSKPGPT